MQEYVVTIWDREWLYGKYSYVIGTNNLDSLRRSLKLKHDRFTIEYAGEF